MDVTREIQESLMNAIQHTSDRSVMNSNSTCTLDCEIVEATDPALGEYKVKVNDNVIIAYGKPSDTYEPGDLVQVLFPRGNDQTSGGATIINAVIPKANVYVEDEINSNIEASENLIDYNAQIELCTYRDEIKYIPDPTTGTPAQGEQFGLLFADYLKDYNLQKFSVNIMTSIVPEQRVAGNYGIQLQLPILTDDGTSHKIQDWYEISMDVNTIQGNPYDLSTQSLQDVYITIPADLEYDNTIYEDETTHQTYQRKPILIAFVDDFAQDSSITKADIFIKDFSFKAIQSVPTEKLSTNYLTVVCDTGRYYLSDDETKILKPVLKVKGKDKKLKEEDYSCFWFKENVSIKSTSEKYSPRGGVGWECMNQRTEMGTNEDGSKSYQYVYNVFELAVPQSDVYSTLRYKCVLIDNSTNESFYGFITLINVKNANVSFELVSANGDTSFLKNFGSISLIAKLYPTEEMLETNSLYSVEQQRFDQKDNPLDSFPYTKVRSNDIIYKEIGEEKVVNRIENEINFSTAYVDKQNTIRCTFYKQYTNENNVVVKTIIGTASILVDTLAKYSYNIIVENGDVVYKYDVDGDSPFVADYGGPISTTNQTIQPIGIRVYKADGTELTENEYKYCTVTWAIPKNSMIKYTDTYTYEDDDYKYLEGNYSQGLSQLNYSIVNVYDKSKSNNEILITVKCNDAITKNSANIKFLKDGESGTNGSKYTAIILQDTYPYGAIDEYGYVRKLQLIYNGVKNKWYYYNRRNSECVEYSNQTLTVDVYCDGIKLTGYRNNITQEIFDSSSTNPLIAINNSGQVSIATDINGNRKTQNGQIPTSNIIRATVRVGNQGATDSQEVIYAYYPIEVSYITDEICNPAIPNITGGYESVLYASDGTNPKYNNNKQFVYSDNIDNGINIIDGVNYYSFNWYVGEEKSRTLPNNTIERYSNLKIESGTTEPICSIKPNTKFDSGVSLNYVKVRMTNSIYATRLGQQQAKLDAEYTNLNTQYNLYDSIVKAISNPDERNFNRQGLKEKFYNERYHEKSFYQSLIDGLKDSKDFISNRFKAYDSLLKASNELSTFEDYYTNLEGLDDSYKNELNTIVESKENEIATQKNIIISYGNPDNFYPYSRVADPQRIQLIELPRYSYNRYYVMLMAAIESFNHYISIYNSSIIDFKNTASNGQANFIYNLKLFCGNNGNMYPDQNTLESIPDDDRYKVLRELLQQLNSNLYSDNEESFICSTSDIQEKIIDEYDRLITEYTEESFYQKYKDTRSNLYTAREEKDIERSKCKKEQDYALANSTIQHTKPIVMLFNIYEQSFLSEQDGNKLYIDEENGQYIIAPRMGAGIKEEVQEQSGDKKRLFTGIVMGVEQNEHKGDTGKFVQKVGLFGYNKSIQSLFLNARDGSAIFGPSSSGQIIIDPKANKGMIYSNNYQENYDLYGKPVSYESSNEKHQGMLIDFTTPEIKFGSGLFKVDQNGNMHAASGDIAGWTIASTQLYKNNLYLDSGTNHYKTVNGVQEIDYISYGIYTNGHDKIEKTGNGFYLSNDGLSIGSKFKATNTGIVYVGSGATEATDGTGKHWTINGDSSHSYIAYGGSTAYSEADPDSATSAKVYIGTDGITLGEKFSVTSSGIIKAYAGNFGDQIIQGHTIESKIETDTDTTQYKIILDANGEIKAQSQKGDTIKELQYIKRKGSVKFTKGKIANQTINEKNLTSSSGNTVLSDDGTITCSKLEASGGHIGGQSIGENSLTGGSGSTTLSKSGTITCADLQASGGNIGSQNISGGSLSAGNVTLDSYGNISCKSGSTTYQEIKSSGEATFNNVIGITLPTTTKVGNNDLSDYVGNIAADKVDATYITGKMAEISSLSTGTINCAGLSASGNITSNGSIIGALYSKDGATNIDVTTKLNSLQSLVDGKISKGALSTTVTHNLKAGTTDVTGTITVTINGQS